MKKITPCLWFKGNGEEAMKFYTSLFANSEILEMHKAPEGTPGMEAGTLLTGKIKLEDEEIMILNGGPVDFSLTPAFSLSVDCADQAEVDKYWNALTADGGEESQCGWLKDKYGVSWQIIPRQLGELMGSPNPAKSGAAMQAMLKMRKIIVADLQAAADAA